MSEAVFLRLLTYDNKPTMLSDLIESIQKGQNLNPSVYIVNTASFDQIPGSTFAYWVGERIRRIFTEFPFFEGEEWTVKQGLATADDFRFVRLWWEVKKEKIVVGEINTGPEEFRRQTFNGKSWVPFAKGGSYSPYYADIHLVLNWEHDGEELRNFKDLQSGKSFAYLRNPGFYFRPGLTWSIKNRFSFKPRPLNRGCIFAHVGTAAFTNNESNLLGYQGLLSSSVFTALLRVTAGWNFEVGIIQRTPVPLLSEIDKGKLSHLTLACINIKRNVDRSNETSHNYCLPALLLSPSKSLAENIESWYEHLSFVDQKLEEYQHEIDSLAFQCYNLRGEDPKLVEEVVEKEGEITSIKEEGMVMKDEEIDTETDGETSSLLGALLSYMVGCVFGRWDVRLATRDHLAPELPDPFAPLPVCSPGMLKDNDGLSLSEIPSKYPIEIDWEGILVDDPDHQNDIIHHVQDVLKVIWKDRAEAIEQESCQLLGVKELREYFRKPGNGGFWMDHVRRYSKSRRKAPIYWPLQSSKKNYALWLYYHCLDKDTLFKALTKYVEPKIRLEDSRLEQWRAQRAAVGIEGREARQLERQVERQEVLLTELYEFRDKLRRAANLNLEPDLNDGVVLNIAPMWELVPWSEAKKYWEELLAGKYEWSSISKQLRSKGVI